MRSFDSVHSLRMTYILEAGATLLATGTPQPATRNPQRTAGARNGAQRLRNPLRGEAARNGGKAASCGTKVAF